MDAEGRKYPCDDRGVAIDPHDPARWMTYDDAAARASGSVRVGWVLNTEDDARLYGPGRGWFFLDLDKCHDGAAWRPEAAHLWQSFTGALGEVSVSGRGLHIMGMCDPAALAGHKNKWDGWLECYTDKRFVALSDAGPAPIGGEWRDVDWTPSLRSFVPEREYLGDLPDGRDPAYTGPEDDAELIAMMLRSGGVGAQFGGMTVKDLWEGNAAAIARKYPSYTEGGDFDHSSADMALMTHLAFWTGKDMPRMDRLFRQSALMRDKYDRRQDYRRDTVQGAARLCKAVYDKPRAAAPVSGADGAASDVYLTVPEMQKHFAGCVYVQNQHRILVPGGRLLKPEQFNAVYGGHMFQMMPDGTKPTRKAFEAFTECAVHRFPSAIDTTFRPDLEPGAFVDGLVNIYVDKRGEATRGDVSPFMEFLERLVPLERDRRILLSWACSVVQNIGRKPLWAVVMQGAEGNGKSMLGEVLSYAVGRDYSHTPRAKELGGTFNGWQENKLLIQVEEVHMNHRREMMDDLKVFITQMNVPVRRMQQAEVTVRCPTAWYMATNHRDAVIKSRNDRRYAVFFTAQQTADDVRRDFPDSFFPKLWDWLRGGGFAHMAHYFRTTQPDPEFDPFVGAHRAPITSSTEDAVATTSGGIEAEIAEAVESEQQGFRSGWISTWHLTRLLKENGMRVSRPKLAEILRDMGYVKVGRAPNPVFSEDGSKPVLWRYGDGHMDFAEYVATNASR